MQNGTNSKQKDLILSIGGYRGLLVSLMLFCLISSIAGCQQSRSDRIIYVPQSDRLYLAYQGDVVTDPNGKERYSLPYDAVIMSNAEYIELVEK